MPFCPICHAEYREGFLVCADCDAQLVDSLQQAKPLMDEESMARHLAEQDVAIVASAPLDQLKSLKGLLSSKGIPNMIVSSAAACGSGNCITGGCGSPTMELIVAKEDIEETKAILNAQFKQLIDTVADDAELALTGGGVVDWEADENHCPACNHLITREDEFCPDCGLFVGIPDEESV